MKLYYKEIPEREYATYPRLFSRYRWFMPLLTGAAALVFFLVFSNLLAGTAAALTGDIQGFLDSLGGGYDSFDTYSPEGALATLGAIAALIPALALAALIVRDRPFSSYGSCMGGFRIRTFLLSLLPAFCALIPSIITTLFADGRTGENRFSIAGFVLCLVLGPLQCIAEEYMFRGYIMQTVGSWTKIPLIGLLFQTAVFALAHPYNIWGVLSIIVMGLSLGFLALYTKGLEAGSAFHTVNNMTAFILTGFGFGAIQTEVYARDALLTLLSAGIMIGLTVLLQKKFHVFDQEKAKTA